MNNSFDVSKQFLITCRDLILHGNSFDIFYSQRNLMTHFNTKFAGFCKRVALLQSEGFDISYWRPILLDALSKGQVNSKVWLLSELLKVTDLNDKTCFVLGGWIGILPLLLFWHSNIKIIRNIELDINCINLSDWLLKDYLIDQFRYKTVNIDMNMVNYSNFEFSVQNVEKTNSFIKKEIPDIIINTSCDHLIDFTAWWDLIPTGQLFALQNNNFSEIDEHTNIVNSLAEFKNQIGNVGCILYEGELDTEKYTRYMIIGVK